MYEDNWPNTGDYDLNDLVVGYRITEELNAKDQVVGLKLYYDLIARGAAYANGFALHLPGITADQIQTVDGSGAPTTSLQVGDKAPSPLRPESGQAEAVFILAHNVNTLTPTGATGGDCAFFNTSNACKYQQPVRLTAEIRFAKPLARAGVPPYNPFLFATYNRGREVHLIDQVPTAKADPRYFSTGDDRSDPQAAKYYRSSRNLPWAIDLPEAIDHPVERRDLVAVYPAFADWAESNGQKAVDWFFMQRDETGIFRKSQQ